MSNPTRKKLIPPQITRLILLTLLIIGGYVGARQVLTPDSFAEYGWYRGRALEELSSLPKSYGGKKACLECHDDLLKKMAKSKHQGLACEGCHGPAYAHSEDPTITPAKITNPQFCLRCHAASPSRPEKFPQVDPTEHFGDQKCSECHQPHSPIDSPVK